MSNKLFVGNLAWSVTNERLKEVFEAFGAVTEAKVILDHESGRSRGFGFVTFQSEEDADRAVAEMNNKEIDGRPVRCDNSQQPEKRERRDRSANDRRGTAPRNDFRQADDRPRRDTPKREERPRTYDNYSVDFPPVPDKMSRNHRRDNRKKDRDYDDDRW